jgi:RNA polymerase sigma-70 factor (ECF subfamily)
MGDDLANLSARFLADRQRLFAYVFALVRSRPVAEDIVQDVYLTISRAVERGEAIADLAAWCRGVARNLALRHWQERQRLERLPPADLLDGIERSFAEETGDEDEALLRALAACRQALPTAMLALLDLKYVHDLPMRDIAERSRRSERAVITALAKLRRRLQDCISTRLAGPSHA